MRHVRKFHNGIKKLILCVKHYLKFYFIKYIKICIQIFANKLINWRFNILANVFFWSIWYWAFLRMCIWCDTMKFPVFLEYLEFPVFLEFQVYLEYHNFLVYSDYQEFLAYLKYQVFLEYLIYQVSLVFLVISAVSFSTWPTRRQN